MFPTGGDETSRGRNPENGRRRDFGSRGVVAVLGFTTLLTSLVISIAFYSEREKFEKVLLRAVNLRHEATGFTSLPKEVILRIFTLRKGPSTPA